MQLSEIIIQRIQENGPLSFRDFMDMALYYPQLGYYNTEEDKKGRAGDYYTSPVLSSLYGQMIARQLEEMWSVMNEDAVSIVEYGAGTGLLCFDILTYLKKNDAMFKRLKYFIIEKSEAMRKKQKQLLHEKVCWINGISDIAGITGSVLSNEVVDNYPVNLVIMEEELMEVFVDYSEHFIEVLRPASVEIKNYFAEQSIALPKGYRTEANLQAIEWIKEIAVNLNKGFVITIDYGFTCHELYSVKRSTGTLACYYKHKVTDLPYSNIGRQDITAHVNFSALQIWGKKYGLEYTGLCNQNYFLRSLGLADHLRKMEAENQNKQMLSQVNQLLLETGNKYKVLIQQKGIKPVSLSGMQFSGKFI